MNKRVLFVDDEKHVLDALRRTLRSDVEVVTSQSAQEALQTLNSKHEPFAVIVSDMRMPEMDGVRFLSESRKICPDAVRIMLTGNADQQTAMDAVNQGEIFRFLTKPCAPDLLRTTLQLAIRQFQLVTAERELLEKTLNGSVKVLTEILSIANPDAFGRTDRIRTRAREIAHRLGGVSSWELDTATSLALLGCIGLPGELLGKISQGHSLDQEERTEYMAHPLLASQLINEIPRMQAVNEIIYYQHKNFDGSGFPPDDCTGADIPLGARILRVVHAYDERKLQGWSDAAIVEDIFKEKGTFDPNVLEALIDTLGDSGSENILRIPVPTILEGMTLCEDVKTAQDVLLVCEGQVVNAAVRQHLQKFYDAGKLRQDLLVHVPERGPTDHKPVAA